MNFWVRMRKMEKQCNFFSGFLEVEILIAIFFPISNLCFLISRRLCFLCEPCQPRDIQYNNGKVYNWNEINFKDKGSKGKKRQHRRNSNSRYAQTTLPLAPNAGLLSKSEQMEFLQFCEEKEHSQQKI